MKNEYIVHMWIPEEHQKMLESVKDGDIVTYVYDSRRISIVWVDALDRPSKIGGIKSLTTEEYQKQWTTQREYIEDLTREEFSKIKL